ncbi:MAG: Uma2 family endonuclease [Trichocoleus desertorum ATA4-8-CV12]|jgi:Uma2 family endonuclease|nr:Uma2 family endonuclease [Trichocoleus desertorum ATA4-8-CV12]
MSALKLNLSPILELTDEQFAQLCQANRDLRLERTATGELIIMPPAGGKTGRRNLNFSYQLGAWNYQNELGVAFDSSTGFRLPKGGDRSPDAAWVLTDRWEALSEEDQEGFVPLCPDFVVELRSKTDSLATLQAKMREYQDNGARLGWLLDPQRQQVEIYRLGQPVETLDNPETLSGEDVLPGFLLTLKPIFD